MQKFYTTISCINGSYHNYYKAENGELFEPTEEQLDWKIYSGSIGKKKAKLKIVK